MAACMWIKARSLQNFKCTEVILKSLINQPTHYTPAACMSSKKHYDPKWKKHRALKFLWLDRTVFDEDNKTDDERRISYKKQGLRYPKEDRRHSPRTDEFSIGDSDLIFDEFVPRKGDGKLSSLKSREAVAYYMRELPFSKIADFQSRRQLKKYEDDFKRKELAKELQNLYIEAMNYLPDLKDSNKREKLLDYVTGFCLRDLYEDFKKRTVVWEFVETVEPPKIVSIRTREVIVKDNIISQLTVRMHSKQKLAVYDQFGRLMLGDPSLVRTVLEYVVFEKHIIDTYGKWRVHGKISPEWLKPAAVLVKTLRKDMEEEQDKDKNKSANQVLYETRSSGKKD